MGLRPTHTSSCATKDECLSIASHACNGYFDVIDQYWGDKDDDFENDSDSKRSFTDDLILGGLSAAKTAVFNPRPWTIEYQCQTPEGIR